MDKRSTEGERMNALTVNGKQLTIDGVEILGYGAPSPVLEEVTIGNQTWLAKNLAIDDEQGGIYTKTVNYGQGDVIEYYYTWDAAKRVAESISGWHLPTYDEWNTLVTTVDSNGNKLKSTYGWTNTNGTDNYGFAAFPAGQYRSAASVYQFGKRAYFHTSTHYDSGSVYYYYFTTNGSTIYRSFSTTSDCYTVRLVKDAT